jgi:hypothetical protein
VPPAADPARSGRRRETPVLRPDPPPPRRVAGEDRRRRSCAFPRWTSRSSMVPSACQDDDPRGVAAPLSTTSVALATCCNLVAGPLITDQPRPPRPRLVGRSVQPIGQEPRTPLRHHVPRHPDILGDLADRAAVRAPQHNLGPQRLRRFPPPGPPGQHRALLVGHHHRINLRARHHHPLPTSTELLTHDTSAGR